MSSNDVEVVRAIARDEYAKLQNVNQKPQITHEDIAGIIQTNYSKCPGGDCGHKKITKNNLISDFKSCPDCQTNTVPEDYDFCPTCGRDHEKDDWDNSDVEVKE